MHNHGPVLLSKPQSVLCSVPSLRSMPLLFLRLSKSHSPLSRSPRTISYATTDGPVPLYGPRIILCSVIDIKSILSLFLAEHAYSPLPQSARTLSCTITDRFPFKKHRLCSQVSSRAQMHHLLSIGLSKHRLRPPNPQSSIADRFCFCNNHVIFSVQFSVLHISYHCASAEQAYPPLPRPTRTTSCTIAERLSFYKPRKCSRFASRSQLKPVFCF